MAELTEAWRAVFDGSYEVSSLGRVRRVSASRGTRPGKLLRARPDNRGKGYPTVFLRISGKTMTCKVHALVAVAFIGLRPRDLEVNHKDGDPRNNAASNLEYVSHADNQRHAGETGLMPRGRTHPGAKITEEVVLSIRSMSAHGIPVVDIGAIYGLSPQHAHSIATRKSWRHIA